jgi:hypothetical protein
MYTCMLYIDTAEFILLSLLYMWMRCSRLARAFGSQCRSRNFPGFDPSILRHSGILGAADEAMLNKVHK